MSESENDADTEETSSSVRDWLRMDSITGKGSEKRRHSKGLDRPRGLSRARSSYMGSAVLTHSMSDLHTTQDEDDDSEYDDSDPGLGYRRQRQRR